VTRLSVILLVVAATAPITGAVERFPPPEFVDTNHQIPHETQPPPRATVLEYLDIAALALALVLAWWFAMALRSRGAMLALTVAAVLYFGFYREGCVCAIGAIQNVALAAGPGGYALPLFVAAIFLMPLIAALLVGRVFCAGVCPLGAIQDLVLIHGVRVPAPLARGLGLLAYAYLGLAVLVAATGSDFLICRYDPFVGIFRLSGSPAMIVTGICLLVLATFIGRPYCRFLCPLGVLLGWCSRLSARRVRITPDKCVRCKLCEDACPFGAILPANVDQPRGRRSGRTALAATLALGPVLVIGGVVGGWAAASVLARLHADVRLSEQIQARQAGADVEHTPEIKAFEAAGGRAETLAAEADDIRGQFAVGSPILGGFLGLMVAARLIGPLRRRTRTDYEADPATCVACARCYTFCPVQHRPDTKLRDLPETA